MPNTHRTRPLLSFLIIAALLLLLTPIALRAMAGWPLMPGAQSYVALRHATTIFDGTAGIDPVTGIAFAPTLYDVTLALFMALGIDWLLPALLAACALTLAYTLFRRALPPIDAFAATAAIALSPAFIVAGTRHESSIAALSLCALTFLWVRKPLLSTLALCAALITSLPLGIITGILLLTISIRDKQMMTMFGVIGAFLIAGAWTVGWHGGVQAFPALKMPSSDVLFEFGASNGLSAFFIILAAYGSTKSARSLPYSFTLTIAIIIAILFPSTRLAASIVVAVLASRGVLRLVREGWELDPLRQLFIVLVWCAAGFLIVTLVRSVSLEQPSDRLVEVLSYIGEQRRSGGVLTDPALAPMVTYFSGRHATLPDDASQTVVRAALFTRDTNALYTLLESTDTSFVLITREMRNGFFTRSDEGILFLLPNTERFVTITSDQDVTLWYYINRQPRLEPSNITTAS